MIKLLRSAALALLAGAAAGAWHPAPAFAEGVTLSLDDDGSRFGLYVGDDRWPDDDGLRRRRGDDRPPRWDDDGPGGWEGGPRWHRRPPPPPPPPRCTAGRALEKAERMGLRRARILDIDRDTIEVSGRRYGERRVVTFARAPFCPVVDW